MNQTFCGKPFAPSLFRFIASRFCTHTFLSNDPFDFDIVRLKLTEASFGQINASAFKNLWHLPLMTSHFSRQPVESRSLTP